MQGRRERAGVRFSGDTRVHWLDASPVSAAIPLPERLESVLTWSQQQLQDAWELTRDQVATRLRATDDDAAI